MPEPKPDEDVTDYVNRCVPVRQQEHPEESKERSVAACYGMFRQYHARKVRKKGKEKK